MAAPLDCSLYDFVPAKELALRQERCRTTLAALLPDADGLLLMGRASIYYLTGTAAAGMLWLPREGAPVLLVRKGLLRAKEESPAMTLAAYRSFREVVPLLAEAGSPLGNTVAVDMAHVSWSTMNLMLPRMKGIRFLDAGPVMDHAMAIKTPYEQEILRRGGQIHAQVMDERLPARIHPGMSERAIALAYVEESMHLGSSGLTRMRAAGETMYFGYASAGVSGNYATYFNGPLGARGECPATPFLGREDIVWQKGQPLTVDMGFVLAGYNTDRTQTYWASEATSVPPAIRRAQDACREILEEAIAHLRPGISPADLWALALARAEHLGYGETFMGQGCDQLAFLGHGVGLCLDEWPAIARTFQEAIVPGMAIALEPKISVDGMGMVGIEHSYLVTEGAPEPITGTQHDLLYCG